MPLNLTVRLDPKSIGDAIRKIQQYRDAMEAKEREFTERLAMLGATVLRANYSNAFYAGTNDIYVTVEPTENGAVLKADGQALWFIEFGAGIDYPEGQYARAAGADPHGTYGKGHGANPPWVYVGDQGTAGRPVGKRAGVYRTYGNPPADAFPEAMSEMVNAVRDIAREVFGQ